MISRNELAGMIDHTLLKADAKKSDIEIICDEAVRNHFYAVCVSPYFTAFAAEKLKGSSVKVCTVAGFPLGADPAPVKAAATRQSVEAGASEIDMVICISALKDGLLPYVENDIREVVRAVAGKAAVKVIIETCYLTDDEKKTACILAEKAGAAYVKTSTGYGTGGATEKDVRLMRETVGIDMGVKASGGIKTLDDAIRMIEAGASRIGTSSGIAIMRGYDERMG